MTLQQIADYAMGYLDSKDVAAEYDFLDALTLIVFTDDNHICFLDSVCMTEEIIINTLNKHLI